MSGLPCVLLFSANEYNLKSVPSVSNYETDKMNVVWRTSDQDLERLLAEHRPDIIVTVGDMYSYVKLFNASFEVRKKWIHFHEHTDEATMGEQVYSSYINSIVYKNESPEHPLVSVVTPTYKSNWRISRAYNSLRNQTFLNWEWVIIDDSDDNDVTYKFLQQLAESDSRVTVYKMHRHSGKIGEVKKIGNALARGSILVELDHDDELLPDCLYLVAEAFRQFPEAGMVYSDGTERFETGGCVQYGEGFGMGYGSYREEILQGEKVLVCNQMHINPKTIRHIVGVPNHVRAWKASVYHEIGGHNPNLHVADDYELIIRTFLKSRMVHIPKLLYVQWMTPENTQDIRRRDIQRLVRYLRTTYDQQIHERFLELGINDYVWDENANGCRPDIYMIPNSEIEEHCTLTFLEVENVEPIP